MFADYSTSSAQTVADGLHYIMTDAPESYFFRLETIRYEPDNGGNLSEIFVRVLPDTSENDPVSILADGTEVVRCLSKDGRRVDVILGQPSEREFQPAQVVFEQPD